MNPGQTLTEQVRFDVQKKIASGTYGTVFLAIQEGIDRMVAIKELQKPDLERLKKETWMQGRLIHPNIVTVFLFNQEKGYIVMEYVEFSLKDKIISFLKAQQHFETDRVVSILRGCLEGLDFAYHNGCNYHGDIKPGNILITNDWQVKLSDLV